MDYTTVPRSLIYRDRRSLEEFGVYDEGNIMFPLADAMLHMAIIRHSDSENRALWCMNTAFYICTMILLEKDPRWRISNYETIAIPSWNYCQLEFKSLTLSLVVLLLAFLKNPLRNAHPYGDKARKDILAWLKKGVMYDELEFKVTTGSHIRYIIPNSTFSPRYIDKEAVHDALAVESFNWVQFVNYFEERSVRDIVKAFGSTEEEKHNVVDLLRQASHGFYTAGYNDYPEKVDKLLDDIDKEIFLDFNPDNEREITEEDKAELIIPIDPEPYEARIKELEKENKELKEQLTQKPTAVENTEAMNSLKRENERVSKEHEEMIVELLKPIFYNSEQDVKEFLMKIHGRTDIEIIDTVYDFLKVRKISEKSKSRPLWKILHAAKYYSSTESNWNTTLRTHP